MKNLKGKGLKDLNLCSHVSGVAAHFNAGVPILQISVPEISEKGMGSLFFFFITSAILMAYTINVNPFTQPGIDEYKKNFLKLILR
jgi:glucose-6-phosphate isomerase